MKHLKNFLVLFFFALLLASNAQEQNVTIEIPEGVDIAAHGFTDAGHFYLFERSKKQEVEARYRLWDQDLVLRTDMPFSQNMAPYAFFGPSHEGLYFQYRKKKGDWMLALEGLDLDINSQTEKDFIIYHELMANEFYVRLGKEILGKKTKLMSKGRWVNTEKVYSDDDYLVYTDIDSRQTRVVSISLPEGCYFADSSTKVLHYTSEDFLVSFVKEHNNKSRTYHIILYDYEGNEKDSFELYFDVTDPEKEKFAITNLENGSFTSSTVVKRFGTGNTVGSTDTDTYTFSTWNAEGNIKFNPFDKTIYAYAAIKPKKGDSGILIRNYDLKGNLLWEQRHILEGTTFKYLNSANRYLSLDIYPKFVGVSVNSTKGTNYCDFYLLNKDTGAITKDVKFKNYSSFKSGKNYNGLYAEYVIKTEGYENLVLDRSLIYTALYDQEFKEYLIQLNTEGEFLIRAEHSSNGLLTVVTSKKGNSIIFKKFTL